MGGGKASHSPSSVSSQHSLRRPDRFSLRLTKIKRVQHSTTTEQPTCLHTLRPAPPAPALLLGTLSARSLLQAADQEGQGHGEDDDATHNRSQHRHSQPTVLRSGNRCYKIQHTCINASDDFFHLNCHF